MRRKNRGKCVRCRLFDDDITDLAPYQTRGFDPRVSETKRTTTTTIICVCVWVGAVRVRNEVHQRRKRERERERERESGE